MNLGGVEGREGKGKTSASGGTRTADPEPKRKSLATLKRTPASPPDAPPATNGRGLMHLQPKAAKHR